MTATKRRSLRDIDTELRRIVAVKLDAERGGDRWRVAAKRIDQLLDERNQARKPHRDTD